MSPVGPRSPVDSVATPINVDPYSLASPPAGEAAEEDDFQDLDVEIPDAVVGTTLMERAELQQAEEDRRKREVGAEVLRSVFRKARSGADSGGNLGLKTAISKSA